MPCTTKFADDIKPLTMKLKPLFITAAAATSLIFAACSESTGNIGIGTIADEDVVKPGKKTFEIELSNMSVDPDSVTNKSLTAYVGKYTDNIFGKLETSFMTQLYCLDDFRFDFDRIVKDTVWTSGKGSSVSSFNFKDVSCYLQFDYESFFGDSLNPCHLQVYQLTKDITTEDMDKTVNPLDYYDPETSLLGEVSYTAANTNLDEEDRTESRSVILSMPSQYASDILNDNYFHPEHYKNADSFINNVFKGMYVRQTTGNGTILYVNNSSLNINFTMYADSAGIYPIKRKTPGYTDQDSTTLYSVSFNSTREVIQSNQFLNAFNDNVINDTEHTYLKSPAGIYTSIKIPVGKIATELANDTILGVKLSLKAYRQPTEQYSMNIPENILLVRKHDTYDFFRRSELPDDLTSFTAAINTKDNTYTFNNIASVITTTINERKEANNGVIEEDAIEEFVIIPVEITTETDSSTNTTTTTAVRPSMKPEYAKLVKYDNNVEVSYIEIGLK